MSEIHTNVEEDCLSEERDQIVRSLVHYNDGHAAPETYRDLVVLSRLDTFEFQALPFNQILDYSIFGHLDDYPAGHTRYFLQKRNLHGVGSV